ncbi:MAG: hypothetical protein JSW39_06530 [Desulfobacterales bacterium]|nr:MAG: hypothetical protein JSW39_06530 [Desulfobacterales bacterium]
MELSPRVVIISTTFMYGKEILERLVEEIHASAPDVFVIGGSPLWEEQTSIMCADDFWTKDSACAG